MSGVSWTLGEIAALSGGRLLHGDASRPVAYESISLDTRTLRAGEFFVNSTTRTYPVEASAMRVVISSPIARSRTSVTSCGSAALPRMTSSAS